MSLDDPRLNPFRELQGRRAPDDTVIIEGELAVTRALHAGAPIRTVVATEGHARRLPIPASVDLVVTDKATLEQLTGFAFHRGVLAAMQRPRLQLDPSLLQRPRCTIVAAAGLADPANVGAIVRTARALGIDLVITDTDPYTRKAIRASAGHCFAQPVMHVESDLEAVIDRLAAQTRLVAATPSDDATDLTAYRRPDRLTILVGSEGPGLSPSLLARAHDRVRIPVCADVDSLNVAVATGILFWHLR